ncbi:MAG: glycosyltransferase family 4 protein [Alphaproteobacteria bacterium]|nr:glycosyltransferase family 4 protein [Alphaproteobacteria bacterium]
MRVVLLTPVLPSEPGQPSRGAGIGAFTLAQALVRVDPGLDLHVVHFRAPKDRPTRTVGDPPFTVHTHQASKLARALPDPRMLQAEVERVLRPLQPDLVHVRGTASLLDGRRWPSVLSVHGVTEREVALGGLRGGRQRALLHQLREPRARARYAHMIAIVGHAVQALEGQLHARVHFVPNAVDPAFFDAGGPRDGTDPLIVHSGDICPIKNQLASVRALAVLARRGVPARLRLVGLRTHPDYAARLDALVAELGLQDRVELPGRIGREHMPAELAAARVLLLPSRVEMAPLAVSEASAVGVPAVVSPAGGNAELVVDRYSGRLCSAESPEGIADALQPYLQDAALATLHGGRAREIAERHRPDAIARATLDVYRAVLDAG